MSATDPPQFQPFPVDKSERIYDSPWCGLRRDMVELAQGQLQEYHVFELPNAVAIVPVLPDDSILMLWQYRYPHGKSHWEIPAGRVHGDEPAEEAARRELLEETGHRATKLVRVAGFYPTNGISPHYADIFLAYDCVAEQEPEHDAAERMSVHVMPADEVRTRLVAGEFEDGFTSLALFYHFARSGRGD